MAKIRCRGCGKAIDERETSCPYCGKRTGGSRAVLTKKKKKRSAIPVIAVCAILLLLVLAAVITVPHVISDRNSPQIENYDDGSRKETVLNSDGLPESYILYDSDDHETESGEYAYENGELANETVTYSDGSSYTAEYDGGIAVSETWYSRDGSRQENSSDLSGNLLSSVIYDRGGVITESEEYSYSAAGKLIYEKSSHSDGSYEEYEYAEDGSLTACVVMNADGSGCRDEYDESGETVKETRYYSDGTSEEFLPD